jgi:MFS family permease
VSHPPSDYTERRLPPWLVPAHVLGFAMLWSSNSAVALTLPIIAKKEFGVGLWAELLITAAPTSLLVFSIFWGDLLRRFALPKYLLVFWAAAMVPQLVVAASHAFWVFAAAFVVSAAGLAAWPAVNGEVMKHLYPDHARGKYFGVLVTCTILLTAGMAWGLFLWLDHDPRAFRTYMPIACGVQLLGVGCLTLLLKLTGVLARREHDASRDQRTLFARVLEPLSHTRHVLSTDKVFARYEAAFMTYGAAWMICEALRPHLVTDKLHLDYAQIGLSASFTTLFATAVATFPTGAIMDRIGPTRLCVLIFGLYTLYPIGLALAQNQTHLAGASVIYGICSAGVNAAWLLGPVSLAPSREKVSQYVAIHATLVGLRGTVFQLVGVALYELTGSFTTSFVVAALGFVWASWQMWRLHLIIDAKHRHGAAAETESSSNNRP